MIANSASGCAPALSFTSSRSAFPPGTGIENRQHLVLFAHDVLREGERARRRGRDRVDAGRRVNHVRARHLDSVAQRNTAALCRRTRACRSRPSRPACRSKGSRSADSHSRECAIACTRRPSGIVSSGAPVLPPAAVHARRAAGTVNGTPPDLDLRALPEQEFRAGPRPLVARRLRPVLRDARFEIRPGLAAAAPCPRAACRSTASKRLFGDQVWKRSGAASGRVRTGTTS